MTAVLSIGSNLGDRAAHLRAAIELLAMQVPVLAVSPVYETAAVGVIDQPAFLNCVALLDGSDPWRLLEVAHAVENARGRSRSRRWGPRSLDVDLIDVDGQLLDDPRLTLPHPRAHERAFVLVPWLDLDRDARLPGRGSVRSLLSSIDRSGVMRWSG